MYCVPGTYHTRQKKKRVGILIMWCTYEYARNNNNELRTHMMSKYIMRAMTHTSSSSCMCTTRYGSLTQRVLYPWVRRLFMYSTRSSVVVHIYYIPEYIIWYQQVFTGIVVYEYARVRGKILRVRLVRPRRERIIVTFEHSSFSSILVSSVGEFLLWCHGWCHDETHHVSLLSYTITAVRY